MILITGAGGKTGRALIREISKAESIRAFVRAEDHVREVRRLGAGEAVVGDMRDTSAVRAAMRGARAVYHICPNMHPDEVAAGELAIREAASAGVRHFVYHSVLHPQTNEMPHHWEKLRVEQTLFQSGLPFTVMQPAPYMQNLLASWNSISMEGILRVPYSVESKFSFVDLEDVAEAARIVLSEDSHAHAVYELAATPALSHVEVAAILANVLGRDIRAEREDIGTWKSRAAGISTAAITRLVQMFEYYEKWGLPGNPNVLRWLLKREPTTLAAFAERTARERATAH